MRVLIDYRPALRQRTGVGEYTHELVRALLARYSPDSEPPLELALFSSSWKDRLLPTADLAAARIIDRRIPVSLLNLLWHRLEWPASEVVAGERFDVTHSSHPLLMPARDAAQVLTIHDLDFLKHPERTSAEVRRDYPVLVAGHATRADAVIVSSQFAAGEVARHLAVPAERISVCPAGAPDWRPRDSPPRDGYILFFGTLEPRKNISGLLDAYEQLPDAPELCLAGRPTDAAAPWLERIAKPPLAGRVRYVGYVADEHRRALYDGARLLVQPSFEEGFGLTVLEAMTAGVPVVASNRGSLPEVIGDAGFLVDPDDPAALASAMAQMLDRGSAAIAARRGIARARTFSWRTTAGLVYDTYEAAWSRRRSRA